MMRLVHSLTTASANALSKISGAKGGRSRA
jgi:hypothetical protein